MGPRSPPSPSLTDTPVGCRSARAERPTGRQQADRWQALPGQDRHGCRPPRPGFPGTTWESLWSPLHRGAPVSASAALVSLPPLRRQPRSRVTALCLISPLGVCTCRFPSQICPSSAPDRPFNIQSGWTSLGGCLCPLPCALPLAGIRGSLRPTPLTPLLVQSWSHCLLFFFN